jgi:hypothetical protein
MTDRVVEFPNRFNQDIAELLAESAKYSQDQELVAGAVIFVLPGGRVAARTTRNMSPVVLAGALEEVKMAAHYRQMRRDDAQRATPTNNEPGTP